jgi:ABC-type nitrate/sulfonate/bicarbonate transport system permease component
MLRERLVTLATGTATIALLLIGVEVLVEAGVVRRALLPPPSAVWIVLVDLIASGEVLGPLSQSLARLAQGFAIGAALAVALGLPMGRFRTLHDLLEPLVELIRPLPKSALIPVLILFLGLGEAMKVTSVALAVFFPVLIATIQGVRGVDPVLIDTARTFRRTEAAILVHIILPATVPFIATGMRIALGLGLVLATLSEMLAGTGGIGFVILDAQRSFRVRHMYAWIMILAAVGLVLNALFAALERQALRWQHDPTPRTE